MPFQIVSGDITKIKCDAIVNAANNSLAGGGGVDGAVHRAAGKKLLAECAALHGCDTGDAKITGGYKLPCKYIIHTVGPIWHGGNNGEPELLASCYRKSLELAEKYDCKSVAFPLISTGAYRYPKDRALNIAIDTIKEFLQNSEMTVYIAVFKKSDFKMDPQRITAIKSYLGLFFNAPDIFVPLPISEKSYPIASFDSDESLEEIDGDRTDFAQIPRYSKRFKSNSDDYCLGMPCMDACSLEEALNSVDESFSEMLLRKIDENGIKDSDCYKKANIDRRLFSKIRSDKHYKPSKITAISFAIALELPYFEFEDMLKKAGFALSHSDKFDIIIEYFVINGIYDIFEINEALFEFDQPLLGA